MQSGTPYGIISFTGQHISPVIDITPTNVSNYAGLIVSSNQNDYLSINTTVPLRGAKNINVNEAIPVVKISTKAQDKACFGVVSCCDLCLYLPRVAHPSEGCISQKHCAAVLFRVYDWEESEGLRRMACRGSAVRIRLAPLNRNPGFAWVSKFWSFLRRALEASK